MELSILLKNKTMSFLLATIIERGIQRRLRNIPGKRALTGRQVDASLKIVRLSDPVKDLFGALTKYAESAYNRRSLRLNQSEIARIDGSRVVRELSVKEQMKTATFESAICELCPGQRGSVVRLEGEATLKQHLLEMGFTKGTEIEFIRAAPLGDPIDLRLRGYRLSLRRAEACAVIVQADIVNRQTSGR